MKNKTTAMLFLSLIAFGTIPNTTHVYANFETGNRNKCSIDGSSKDNSDDNSGGAGGEWTQEGTGAYKNAKNIWDFWKGKGYSGSAIAGVLGNVAHEGGFEIPDRAEGHYGSDSKNNGISAGIVPSVGSGYPVGKTGKAEGGGGHYQFTPYTKFADLNDKKWLDSKAQSEFVWNTEAKNASWGRSYADSAKVEKAVADWFKYYERGASLAPAKLDSGIKAYKVFGGDKISFDSSLFNNTKDTDTNGSDTNNNDSKNKKTADNCYTNSSDNSPKSNIVDDAKSLLGYFSYLQAHGISYIGGDIKNPKKSGTTDCSGFVWLVLARLGYSVPENMGWFTGSMAEDAKGSQKWLKKIDAKDAKAGDIIVANQGNGAGNNGHTAFLTEDYHGTDTKIIQSGGEGDGSICGGTIKNSFGSLLSGDVIYVKALKK